MYNVYKSLNVNEASERDLAKSLTLADMLWLCYPSKIKLITKENKREILDTIRRKTNKGEISNFLVHYETGMTNGVRNGHWCCISIKGNNVYFFDPLGLFPDEELKKIDTRYRVESGQVRREIALILLSLKRSGYNIHYNDIKFQRDSPEISTCGRYCVCFFETVRKLTSNEDPYIKMREILNNYRKNGETYYDEAVVRWCKKIKKYGLM